MRYSRILHVIGIGGGGGDRSESCGCLGIPDITIKIWVCWDETRISQLYHYVCEQLEILLIFSSEFTSNIKQPISKEQTFAHTCNRYRNGGGGGGVIRKLWLLGIPDITIKTWVCWDETRISQLISLCMWTARNHNFYFRIHLYNPAAMRKCVIRVYVLIRMEGGGGVDQKVVAAWYPRHYTIKTWVCWNETRISQLYHYVCKHLEILLIYFFWIHL